ncbi:MAG: hypothetical protein K2I00_10990 [Ruminococcus sp.]|nr:hypothetical protein [Ruminococcus sp.]
MARKSRVWSDEKIAYVQSMMPDKKIMFITLSSSLKGQFLCDDDYDIILGYTESHGGVYAVCDATLHKKRGSISFGFKYEDIQSRNIKVRYKALDNTQTLYERVLLIPCKELEEFCKNCEYYLYYYKQDDEKEKLLGVYNSDTDEIELKSE